MWIMSLPEPTARTVSSWVFLRFAIVCLMRYFLDVRFDIEYARKVALTKSDDYYIIMAIAWYFATALTNLVLTQIALLSLMSVPNMQYYNSLLGLIIGVVILGFAIYLVIDGFVKKHKIIREKNRA